jgi:hypothetical protein
MSLDSDRENQVLEGSHVPGKHSVCSMEPYTRESPFLKGSFVPVVFMWGYGLGFFRSVYFF